MPTVILLDVSLSMSRPIATLEGHEETSRRHLAVAGINPFLDYLASNCKLEFVSLVIFSSLYEQVVPFTRDYNEIRTAVEKLEDYDKTCIETALGGVNMLIVEEWGASAPCQVVLVTDGALGFGEGSLKQVVQAYSNRSALAADHKFSLPFKFPCKLHVLLLGDSTKKQTLISASLLRDLISVNGQGGELFMPEGSLSVKTVQGMFSALAEKYYSPFVGVLKCGNLTCPVHIFPTLDAYDRVHEFEHVKKVASREIRTCGFIDIADIASPPYISRHLVLPISANQSSSAKTESNKDDSDEKEDKSAAFTVLLHGSLKVESMIALVQIFEDWYGMMYSYADSKKKSNLMLSVFEPGPNVISWLGSLSHLGPVSDLGTASYKPGEGKSPFPVCPTERRSYSQNCVVWIKNTGLHTDIQKILRNARKLPEKLPHFYKELNRLRRAALALGFYELLDAVAQLLDRECTLLAGNTHPDAALQMAHVASFLRSEVARDAEQNIVPLQTNFSTDWGDRSDR